MSQSSDVKKLFAVGKVIITKSSNLKQSFLSYNDDMKADVFV